MWNFKDGKPIWKSKTFWGAVLVTLFTMAKTLEGQGWVYNTPEFQAVIAGLGVLLSMIGMRDAVSKK